MKDHVVSLREVFRSKRDRAVRPVLEGLEERLLMYTATGDHFVDNSRITWSIVPDGTNLGGVTSNLQSTLNTDVGAGNWINAFRDAFAVWENVGNVNVSQVGDNGEETDSDGLQQGSNNVGDIRIGGYSQSSSVLAYTLLPPAANGGSDSGDIFFNTSQAWNIGSNYDLETVAVHEIGHALAGLGESSVTTAAEYEYYSGVRQSLAQDDINGMLDVWGPRIEDGFTLGNNNTTSANAAVLTSLMSTSNDQINVGPLDVASSSPSYWFKFTTPANASTNMNVQVQSLYLSELSPKLQLYNASLTGLVSTSAPTIGNGATIDASIGNATPNTTYYVQVMGSSVGASGTGAYALAINMGSSSITLENPPYTGIAAAADEGGGGVDEKVGIPNLKVQSPTSNNPVPLTSTLVFDSTALVAIPLKSAPSATASRPTLINVPHPLSSIGLRRPVAQILQSTLIDN